MGDIDEELLEDLYAWVDQIPLSRPKKDIKRDFADGVLVAEIIKYFLPKMVDTHNYVSSSAMKVKQSNWHILQWKVFKKLGFEVGEDVIKNICSAKPWAVEQFLMMLRRKIDRHLYESRRGSLTEDTLGDGQRQYDQMTEADRGYIGKTPSSEKVKDYHGYIYDQSPRRSPQKESYHSLNKAAKVTAGTSGGKTSGGKSYPLLSGPMAGKNYKGEMVPKIQVEEKEQEILAKDETIQILQAKVRRLEHLLHLKDIRIDDLTGRLDRLESQLKPTNYKR